jgi:hypothetical protein
MGLGLSLAPFYALRVYPAKRRKQRAEERTRTADLLITSERSSRPSAARTSTALFRLLPISTGRSHPRLAGRGI